MIARSPLPQAIEKIDTFVPTATGAAGWKDVASSVLTFS
jgi:hypothetical protein